jgi:hypothetical protein
MLSMATKTLSSRRGFWRTARLRRWATSVGVSQLPQRLPTLGLALAKAWIENSAEGKSSKRGKSVCRATMPMAWCGSCWAL